MTRLFYCCLELDNKTCYMIINIFDIVFALMQLGYIAHLLDFIVLSESLNYVIYGALLLIAIVSLAFYVS